MDYWLQVTVILGGPDLVFWPTQGCPTHAVPPYATSLWAKAFSFHYLPDFKFHYTTASAIPRLECALLGNWRGKKSEHTSQNSIKNVLSKRPLVLSTHYYNLVHFSFTHLDSDWAPMVQSLVSGCCCGIFWQTMGSMKERCLCNILSLSPSLLLSLHTHTNTQK